MRPNEMGEHGIKSGEAPKPKTVTQGGHTYTLQEDGSFTSRCPRSLRLIRRSPSKP